MINITLIEANKKIIERYGNSVPQIVSYEEDDGTVWYRFFYYDGIEMMWDGFESVEEAFLSLCKFVERR